MIRLKNFAPLANLSESISPPTTTSQSITFNAGVTGLGADELDVLATNDSDKTIYVAFGKTTATAVAPSGSPAVHDIPIRPGGAQIINIGRADTVAVIIETGTATGRVTFTPGFGS